MEYEIKNNVEKHQFELSFDNSMAFITYRLVDGGIAFLHTEVPAEMEGKGIGSAMARHVLDYAIAQQLEIYPYCPFIHSYIKRHQEYQPHVAKHWKEK